MDIWGPSSRLSKPPYVPLIWSPCLLNHTGNIDCSSYEGLSCCATCDDANSLRHVLKMTAPGTHGANMCKRCCKRATSCKNVRGSQERGGIGCKSPMVCFLSVKLKTPTAKMRGVLPGFAIYQGSAKPRTFQLARWPLKPNAREPFSMRVKGSPKAIRDSVTMNSGMDPYCRFYRSHALVHTLHAVRRGSPEPYQREIE